jgi:CheY-like chemotaxis protein
LQVQAAYGPHLAVQGMVDQTSATLLVVDDDAMNRDVLSRRLVRSGYKVLTAEGGAQALELVNGHRFDAVHERRRDPPAPAAVAVDVGAARHHGHGQQPQ